MAPSIAASDRPPADRRTVLHVLSGFSIAGTLGGAERVAATILKSLEASPRYSPALCILRSSGQGNERHGLTAPVRYLGYAGPDLDWRMAVHSVPRLRQALREIKPDIVHSHLWLATFTTGLALLGTGIPHVIHIQDQRAWLASPRLHQRLRRMAHRFLIRANKATCIACSQATADFTGTHLGPLAGKMVVVRSGIDVGRFKDIPEPPGMAGTDRPVVFGMAARMIPEKGVADTIRACADLRDRHLPFRLRLAGAGSHQFEFERLAKDLDLGEQVEFMGLVRDILGFYAGLDVLVLPSRSTEGIPISVLEAMAVGRPVVVTSSSGIPEAVRDGQEGFVVPPGDVAALADALARLVADAGLRRDMGARAKARIERNFSAEDMVRSILQVYDDSLGGPEAARG